MTLAEYHTRYETILHSSLSDREKTMRLSSLMSELESAYNIPMIRKPEWEKDHKKIIALYRMVSNSRTL